jgi:hypothetical protein
LALVRNGLKIFVNGAGHLRGIGAQTDEGDESISRKNPHWGTALDEFLAEDGVREAVKAEALTRVIAWQLTQEMERQGITKVEPAPPPS